MDKREGLYYENYLNANGEDKMSSHIGKYLVEKFYFEKACNSEEAGNDYLECQEYDKWNRTESGL